MGKSNDVVDGTPSVDMDMDIVYKKLSEIKPYWRNPRVNNETVPDLIESIKKFGLN